VDVRAVALRLRLVHLRFVELVLAVHGQAFLLRTQT
jgi:hypothetical protein